MIPEALAAWLGLVATPDPQMTQLHADMQQMIELQQQQNALLLKNAQSCVPRSSPRFNAELAGLQAATRKKMAQ